MNSLVPETVRDFMHVNTSNLSPVYQNHLLSGIIHLLLSSIHAYAYLSSALVWYAFVIFTNLSSVNLLNTSFDSVKSSSDRINYYILHLQVYELGELCLYMIIHIGKWLPGSGLVQLLTDSVLSSLSFRLPEFSYVKIYPSHAAAIVHANS